VTVADEFTHDVFLSHSAKDKAVLRPLAERLKQDGLRAWLDEWKILVAASRQSAASSLADRKAFKGKDGGALPRRRYKEMMEEGLERSRVSVLCMSANAFGSDCAQLEAGTFRFRDPLNKERCSFPSGSTPPYQRLFVVVFLPWRVNFVGSSIEMAIGFGSRCV